MKRVITFAALFSMSTAAVAQEPKFERVAPPLVRDTVPPLADYTDEVLFGSVWKRTELAPRDRSLVTLAALIAGGHTRQMTGHLNRALDNGVTPAEITETVTHLAFYTGWPNSMSAVGVVKEVFEKRGIETAQLTTGTAEPLSAAQVNESKQVASIDADIAPTVPALADYSKITIFSDLWLRPQLAPRDRSLVTVAALIAGAKTDELPAYLDQAMSNGLTRTEASEVVTHLAFYTGWPNAMSAVPVLKTVFESRGVAPE